jgi:hypothetical protein
MSSRCGVGCFVKTIAVRFGLHGDRVALTCLAPTRGWMSPLTRPITFKSRLTGGGPRIAMLRHFFFQLTIYTPTLWIRSRGQARGMHPRCCRFCRRVFEPSRFHPEQTVCSDKSWQQPRRSRSRKRKLVLDPGVSRRLPRQRTETGSSIAPRSLSPWRGTGPNSRSGICGGDWPLRKQQLGFGASLYPARVFATTTPPGGVLQTTSLWFASHL